jgi:hypothetical protein
MRLDRNGLFFLTLSVACLLIIEAVPSSALAVQREPTPEEKAEMELLGYTATQSVSDEEIKLLRGGCPKSPYPLLLKHYKPGPQSAKAGQAGITKLNSDFACRLSKLIEQFPAICIHSAYRSPETQKILWERALVKYGSVAKARKWVAPPGPSKHNKGLAADLCDVPNEARAQVRKFGLYFRMGNEPWHIEPFGDVGPNSPNQGDGGTQSSNSNSSTLTSPSSQLTSALRKALGFQDLQTQQGDCLVNTSPIVVVNQPCSQLQQTPPIISQQLPQNQQLDQFFKPPQGSSGSSSNGGNQSGSNQSPTTHGGTSGSGNTPQSDGTNFNPPQLKQETIDYIEGPAIIPYKPSIAEQLMEIAFGPDKKEGENNHIVASSSFPIIIYSGDVASTSQELGTETTSSTTSTLRPISAVPEAGIQPPQTFVSPEIASDTSMGTTFAPQPTGVFSVLENMKRTLLWMLDVLRPMGISSSLQGEEEHSEESE